METADRSSGLPINRMQRYLKECYGQDSKPTRPKQRSTRKKVVKLCGTLARLKNTNDQAVVWDELVECSLRTIDFVFLSLFGPSPFNERAKKKVKEEMEKQGY